MKRMVQMVLIGWVAAAGYGQAMPIKNEGWNRGELELLSGTVLNGELNYNWKAEVIQLRQTDGRVKAYSAFQVNGFAYFDGEHNTIRRFTSVNFPVKPTLDRQLFLEEYATGPFTVYRRLRHQHEPIRVVNPAQFGTDELVYDDLDGFMYYVFDNESIIALTSFDRELWPRMQAEFGKQLMQYRNLAHLDTNTTLAKLLLIGQYNDLKTANLSASASTTRLPGYGND